VSSAGHHARLTPWATLVTVSAVLVVGCLGVLATLAVASQRERVVSYPVRGSLSGLTLDLGDADVTIARGGRRPAVEIERRERFAFGRSALATRQIDGGVFMLRSRCPRTVLHSCSVRYRVVVPDNVPLTIRTTDGTVRFRGYRGSARVTTERGDIDITGFCGFSLQARADGGGDIDASTACPPPQLSLRTTTGAVRARVPVGRYRVDASTSGGGAQVRGVTVDAGAPFAIQALSGSGAVSVERGP
jgi:hypothetical protein